MFQARCFSALASCCAQVCTQAATVTHFYGGAPHHAFATVLCCEKHPRTPILLSPSSVCDLRGFHRWIRSSLSPFFTARQARRCTQNTSGFMLQSAAIFLALITTSSGASARHVPGSMDDPQGGKIKWKPAKPDASEILSKYLTKT